MVSLLRVCLCVGAAVVFQSLADRDQRLTVGLSFIGCAFFLPPLIAWASKERS